MVGPLRSGRQRPLWELSGLEPPMSDLGIVRRGEECLPVAGEVGDRWLRLAHNGAVSSG